MDVDIDTHWPMLSVQPRSATTHVAGAVSSSHKVCVYLTLKKIDVYD